MPAFFYRGSRCHALAVVAVRYENAAVCCDDYVVRLIEMGTVGTGLPRDAQAHQQFAVGTEFVHLLALGAVGVGSEVGDPHVTFMVRMDAVGYCEKSRTEIGQHFPCVTIELEYRIDRIRIAVDRPAGSHTGSGSTALIGPDMAIDGIDIDSGRVPPGPSSGQFAPLVGEHRIRIGNAFSGDDIADDCAGADEKNKGSQDG